MSQTCRCIPGIGGALEKLGMSGVWGVRPACPLVMSYPALMLKPVVGGAKNGPDGGGAVAPMGGGGPEVGEKGIMGLVYGTPMAGGGMGEAVDMNGGPSEGWIGGREVVAPFGGIGVGVEKPSGAKEEMPVVLGRDMGLDRPVREEERIRG